MLTYNERRDLLREHQHLSNRERAELIWANPEWIIGCSEGQNDYLVTPILRTYCGCDLQYFDEILQEWIEVNDHGPTCHRKRFPILQDLTDRTLKRRDNRVAPYDVEKLEESIHA